MQNTCRHSSRIKHSFVVVLMIPRVFCRFTSTIMAAAKPSVVFVLGGPGAGKGTQCSKIVEVSQDSRSEFLSTGSRSSAFRHERNN